MNSYDFDKTIFNPDSSVLFAVYSAIHHPICYLRAFPKLFCNIIKYLAKKIDFKELKESSFGFLMHLKDIDADVNRFWDKRFCRIESWYLKQKKDDDIIISASPEFLLKPVAEKLGVRLIATRMDKHTGKITGLNCHDEEKVRRLHELYPDAEVENFYSDSLADTPMAMLAKKAFIVNKDVLKPWPNK